MDQLDLFGGFRTVKVKTPNSFNKQKQNWENRFQRWSTESYMIGGTHYGACGYGSMCDYCEDNSYGRPCVRALNAMCRDKGISIDYANASYEDVWNGEFKRKGDA